MSKIKLWIVLAVCAVIDAAGAMRVALDKPDLGGWWLAGYLSVAAVLFGLGSWRARPRPADLNEGENRHG